MYDACIICGSEYHPLVLNGLPMLQCNSCGLIWRKEFTLREGHYERKENSMSEGKLQSRLNNCMQRLELVRQYCVPHRTCDVGCGEGLFLKVLKDAGYNDCFGIEPGIFAQGYAEKHGLRIKQGRIEDLGELLNEEVVSVITLFHVVEHLQDPRAAIKLIHDHLPIGGHLVLETPDIDSYMIRKLDYRHPLIYPEHLFYFNEQTLCALLTDVGFSIIDSGRRDFDLPHTSIRQLLGYVGLSAQVGAGASEELCRQGSERGASSTERRPLIRRLASHMLAATVHMLNRENYIWMVARREK